RDRVTLSWKPPLGVEADGKAVAASPAVVPVAAGGEVAIRALRDGATISPAEIRVGERRASEQPVRLKRSWWWLIEILFAQLIAVALPEELLFRGYFQARLGLLFARRRRILGAEVSV